MRCLVPDVSAGPTEASLYDQSYAYFTRAICRRSKVEEKPKTRVERAKAYMNGKLAQLSEVTIRRPTTQQLRNIAISTLVGIILIAAIYHAVEYNRPMKINEPSVLSHVTIEQDISSVTVGPETFITVTVVGALMAFTSLR